MSACHKVGVLGYKQIYIETEAKFQVILIQLHSCVSGINSLKEGV